MPTGLTVILQKALRERQGFIDPLHQGAFRLFNGFTEGLPAFSLDIYAQTALIHNYSLSAAGIDPAQIIGWLRNDLPWVNCIIMKTREGSTTEQKRGQIVFGSHPADKIIENGIHYAIHLTMNRDASFYMDTRNLRKWARDTLTGKSVLNTFAYTGSLGIAALGGGASHVVQLDKNKNFLNVARQSCELNNFTVPAGNLIAEDFFPAISRLKKSGQRFDCIFLDPPFFASTAKGRVDLEENNLRLINKIRPLINDGGFLVAINNALFVSGSEYISALQSLCADGYLGLEQIIPIPADFTGFSESGSNNLPANPAPFNHSTKIAIMRVRRKLA